MYRRLYMRTQFASLIFVGLLAIVVVAQTTGLRKLAPGVVTKIMPELKEEETFSGPREIVELVHGAPQLDWTPHSAPKSETLLAKAKTTIFRREIWGLEFGFKPMRMIDVEVTDADGTVRRKQVRYLVYYVRNNGLQLNPKPETDESGNTTFTTERVNHTIRFFPNFILYCHDVSRGYLDQVIPEAVERIRQREDANRKLHNSVTISDVKIGVSSELDDNSVWGVATWTDVDPRSDFFSVYVRGLTNAYRWQDPPGAYKEGDPPGTGRRFLYKTLQLNFWRPGDAIQPRESEIRYGVPNRVELPPGKTEDEVLSIYRLEDRVDHRWVYR